MDPRVSLALWLRAGRVQRGLTLEDVSRVTKIQTRTLERLESGKPEGLPADVFVRGFVRSFAKCVGLDEDEALRRYGECGVASAPAVMARAMVEAMADLAPSAARAFPSRPSLASGSRQDLPRVEALGEAPRPSTPALEVAVVSGSAAAAAAGEMAPAPVEIAPIPVESAAPAPVGAAAAGAIPAAAAPAPAKKKRTRRAAIAGSGTGTGSGTSTGRSRSRRKPIAIGTPVEASPAIAEGAPAMGEAAEVAAPSTAGGEATRAPAAAETTEVAAPPAALEAAPAVTEAAEVAAPPALIEPASASVEGAAASPVVVPGVFEAAAPAQISTAAEPGDAAPAAEPAEGAPEERAASATWRPKMPPAATQSVPPWRRPRHVATSSQPGVPSLVIDDADPERAEQVLEERTAAKSVMTAAQRRSFLPPVLLDREDRSARQGTLTLAVIILLIAATLTLSYLMRRPSSSGDGVTQGAAPAQLIG